MTATYRINTPVGPIARWLPSLDAAKERYIAATLDAWRFDNDGQSMPVITFEQSTEDYDGEAVPEYTRCLTDGRWDSSILVERPDWPSYVSGHGASPGLAMQRITGPSHCPHERLICSNTCTPHDGIPEPRIRCESCGTTWEPS